MEDTNVTAQNDGQSTVGLPFEQQAGNDHLLNGIADHLTNDKNTAANGGPGGGGSTGGAAGGGANGGGGGPPPPSLGGGDNGGGGGPISATPPASGGGDNASGAANNETSESIVDENVSVSPPPTAQQNSVQPTGGLGLGLPSILGGPFTAADVALPALDTSGYRSKRRASKAAGMHDIVRRSVQTRIGSLVGIANQITKVKADIDAAAAQHVAGLQTSRGLLQTTLAAARTSLTEESGAARERIKAVLDAERGAVRDAASGVRGQLKSASRGMRSSVGRAHDRAMTTISEGFDQSITLLSEGTQSYREGIGARLSTAYDSLSIPGRTSIWTCVHYQIREQLGAQFGNSGTLFQTLQSVETQFSDALLEVYTAHSERLDELLGQGKGNADSAYRSGRNEVNSYEKSALKALDKTETTVFAQIEAATQSANGRLEGVEQQQTAALDTAEQQTTADAENFKTSTEAALWAGAHAQGDALVATAQAATAPLEDKPRQKTVDAALNAVNAVPIDITTGPDKAQQMVNTWSAAQGKVRTRLDTATRTSAQTWLTDAKQRVANAEQRSNQSIQSTSQGVQDGLKETNDRLISHFGKIRYAAKSALSQKAQGVQKALISDTGAFVEGLDTHEALDASALSKIEAMRSAQYAKVDKDLRKRAGNAHAAMFDAGFLNGTDETKLFTALRGIGPYGADALNQAYRESTPRKNIYADIRSDLTDEEYRIASAYLADNDAVGVSLELEYHRDGFWGPDTEAITALLKDIDAKTLTALKALPDWDTTEKNLYESLEGDDLDLRVVQSLIAGNKARAEALELIDKIVDARWDEDEQALRDAVAGIPADSRKEILVQFAVLHELAGREGGLDAVDFTAEEVDADLAEEMGQAATGKDADMAIKDDLSTSSITKAEQMFGDWVSQDRLADDALYQEGGPSYMDVAVTSIMLAPFTLPGLNIVAAYELEKSEVTNSHVLDASMKDLVHQQGTYGGSSLQGRAAELNYEVTEGENVEKAYKALQYTHTDDQGRMTNSAFKTSADREGAHADWNAEFEQVYQQQYGNSARSDINRGDFSSREKDLLQETRTGGQGSAHTMLHYAQDGLGTEEWAAENALQGASQTDIDAYFANHPGAREALLSEFSGDELENIRIMLIGQVETDKQRWEIAKIRWEFVRGSGSGSLNPVVASVMGPSGAFLMGPGAPKISANHFWDLMSGAGGMMDFNYEKMQSMIAARGGEESAFDENGMLIILEGDSPDAEIEQLRAFRGAEESLAQAEETYKATTDAFTNLIATVAGIVAGAIVSIATAGAAAPAVVALVAGLTTMATKAALKGDRYGWEEMAQDGGILAVEVATAGLATKLTNATKMAHAEKAGDIIPVTKAELAAYKLPKNVELGLKAGESFVSNTGKTLMDEKTYEEGTTEGILKAFKKGGKGVASTYISHVTKGISKDIHADIQKKFKLESNTAKYVLQVSESGLASYMSGQTNLMVADMVDGTSELTKKQSTLVESAMYAMISKTLTVKNDTRIAELKAEAELNGESPEITAEIEELTQKNKTISSLTKAGVKTAKTVKKAIK